MSRQVQYLIVRILIVGAGISSALCSDAQKSNFINYSVEQGLIQSQAFNMKQDQFGMLWIATVSGLSRFDGVKFHNYDKNDGLTSKPIFEVFIDETSVVWIGSEGGMQSYDGRKFTTYRLPLSVKSNPIIDINEDRKKQLYFISANGKFCRINNIDPSHVEEVEKNDLVTAITRDATNTLYAAFYKKGIYQVEDGRRGVLINNELSDANTIVQKLFFDRENRLWILCNKGVYVLNNGHATKINEIKSAVFFSIAQDALGRVWVGTSKGAFTIGKNYEVQHIGAAEGLTDNTVYDIVRDREDNLWFATDGEGIFKLADNSFTYLDKSSGLSGNVVMVIEQDEHHNFWLGTSDGGLQKFNGKSFRRYVIPSLQNESQKINSSLYDSVNGLWLGTIGGGLWQLKNEKFSQIFNQQGQPIRDAIAMYHDRDKNIWLTTTSTIYISSKGLLQKINAPKQSYFSLFQLSGDSMLVGSSSGVGVISNGSYSPVPVPGVGNTTVVCFSSWRNYIVMGGMESGITFWDPSKNISYHCSQREGLSSNNIFSFFIDGPAIWAGTGHGISRIEFEPVTHSFTIKNFPFLNNPLGPECNLNAVRRDTAGRIWFGTTKGVAICNTALRDTQSKTPLIYLNSIQLFSKPLADNAADTLVAWCGIPKYLSLEHSQNQLTFEFSAVYLSDPVNIKYCYELQGLDTSYSNPVTVPKVIYSNLAPGKYVFRAFAVSGNEIKSANTIIFPFEIKYPFYQKAWFRVAVILLLIGLGVFIQYILTTIRKRRMAMVDRIRNQEQKKIQERTSEDLHDDLGNKITRIAVLTDILQNKTEASDVEKQKLLKQIKDNVQALYLGTKDIIWAFMPESNSLASIVERLQSFGLSLFEDTGVEFAVVGPDDSSRKLNIPPEISRNVILIVKEALNNILKHSEGSLATLTIQYEAAGNVRQGSVLQISINDNGKGIPSFKINGNGLENIRKRTERLNGQLQIKGAPAKGTSLVIRIRIPQKEGYAEIIKN